jgi:hypothetical protein
MILFPDTHFFLHYIHPQVLPWSDVSQDSQITLMVGRAVQKELVDHKFKFGLRGRPQQRARDYVAKLGDIVTTGKPLVLCEANPTVVLDLWLRPRGCAVPNELEPLLPDDQLVADALAYNDVNPGNVVAVLTGDPGVLATAKAHGLQVISLLERGWELGPESSSDEKELKKLRQENAELKRRGPSISCELFNGSDKLEKVLLQAQRFSPLSAEVVEQLVDEILAANPEAAEFNKPRLGGRFALDDYSEWVPPTAEIEAYRQKYREWVAGLKPFIEGIHLCLTPKSASVELGLTIGNEGVEPADIVILSIETVGGFLLAPIETAAKSEEDDLAKIDIYPEPPQPPSPTIKTLKIDFSKLASGGIPELVTAADLPLANVRHEIHKIIPHTPVSRRHDRNAFYRLSTDVRNGATLWQFECHELRHHDQPEKFPLRISADIGDLGTRNGALKVKLSAHNLRKPFECTFRLRLDCIEGDTYGTARKRLRTLMIKPIKWASVFR